MCDLWNLRDSRRAYTLLQRDALGLHLGSLDRFVFPCCSGESPRVDALTTKVLTRSWFLSY